MPEREKHQYSGALVKTIRIFKTSVVLLAPTGRAAKVLSSYCNHPALLFIKRSTGKGPSDGTGKFVLDRNLHRDTLVYC
jgi:exodeoxyribonuclease V